MRFAGIMLLAVILVPAPSFGQGGQTVFDLTGTWEWHCCQGRHAGNFTVERFSSDGSFSGRFGNSASDGATPFEGRLVNSRMEFRRSISSVPGQTQVWTADLRAIQGGFETVNGRWSGYGGGTAPDDFYAKISRQGGKPDESQTTVVQVGPGLTQYTVVSRDQDAYGGGSGQELDMGTHAYCALTHVGAGGFNSACLIQVRNGRWILIAVDPRAPDPWQGESQACGAICFDR